MLEPIYRIEFFLDAIVNNTTPPEPIYRAEFYLAKIAGADVEIPEPVYRMEKYLAYLCGEEVELPDPIYRIEYYLAFLCGLNVELPEPVYRIEFWLWDWCGGGGIEKTIIGNPIHILDALAKPAQSLSVKLEPIQDLHGYDNPWPAGGGKNKFPVADWFTAYDAGTNLLLIGNTSVFLTAGQYTLSFEYYVDGAPAVASFWRTYSEQVTAVDASKQVQYYSLGLSTSATSWTSVTQTFTLNSDGWFGIDNGQLRGGVHYRNIQVETGASKTSFAPYSNICPIYGHTDADVTRTGKNLLDKAKAVLYNNGQRFIKYGVDAYADTLPNGDCVLDAGTYTLSISGDGTEAPASLAAYDSSGNRLAIIYNNKVLTFTTTSAGACYLSINFVDAVTWADYNIQLELGSTASAYSPYVGTTYPIPIGQTVYGGTLDVLTGVLTVDRAKYTFSGSESWGFSTSFFYSFLMASGVNVTGYYITENGVKLYLNGNNGQARVYLNDNSFLSASSDMHDYLNSTIGFVYELATPQTVQLTPQQVELLQGENNIWSDGEMTLVYLADGNASDEEALNILLGGRYVNNHTADEPTDREALDILLGR